MDGVVILLLFVVIAAWLMNRGAQKLRIGLSGKSYVTLTVVVVVGVLLLYATQQ